MEYTACWDYPPDEYKKKVKVLEKKFCWLYPEDKRHDIDKIIPNFKECEKALYTKCDRILEGCAHEQILKVDNEFWQMQKLLSTERVLQNKLVEELRYHSTRYLILIRGVCVKFYPEFLSGIYERRCLCEFQRIRNDVNGSNCRLSDFLLNISESIGEMKRRIGQLDHNVESPFIVGIKPDHPPLASVMEILQHMYEYYFDVVCKLKCWAELLDPADDHSLQEYLTLLRDLTDFQKFLSVGTDGCTCLRTNKQDPLRKYYPCYCRRISECEDKLRSVPKSLFDSPIFKCDVEVDSCDDVEALTATTLCSADLQLINNLHTMNI